MESLPPGDPYMHQRLGGNLRRPNLTTLKGLLLAIAVPIVILISYKFGGETWLLLTAVFLPLPLLMRGVYQSANAAQQEERDGLTGFLTERYFHDRVNDLLAQAVSGGRYAAIFMIELDTLPRIRARYGDGAAEEVLRFTARRLSAALRSADHTARIGDARFAICLDPVEKLDIEMCLQLAARIQTAIEEPVPLQAASLHLTCSVGFCLQSRLPNPDGNTLIVAGTLALNEAVRTGGSTIRSYSADMKRLALRRDRSENEALQALDLDQIRAWFQPQISTDTGEITGFEALARWEHPVRGILPPLEFLPAMERAGQLEQLSDRMLFLSLTALQEWEKADCHVPNVGVNFSNEELTNPGLLDKVSWELDRHNIAPERLSVEVLETVVAGSPNDIIVRNVNGLAKLGCKIDLDDFGTGHASISSIRNFSVSRLKMDRSFVMRSDTDPDQQKMVAAIVTMAERLGLEVLAEGVETSGEHAMLAQLGCSYVQGFGVARPMPFVDTLEWIREYRQHLLTPPSIGRRAG